MDNPNESLVIYWSRVLRELYTYSREERSRLVELFQKDCEEVKEKNYAIWLD